MILFGGAFCYDDPSMFGEKARRIEELEQQVAELEEERGSFAPFIADAQAIHAEVSNLMSRPGTTEKIAQTAFEHVLATRRNEVETSLRDFHIQANIDDLLEAAADTVEQTEGERIAVEAAEMVESDSKLAAAVQEKARQVVWEEALARIADNEKEAAAEALLLEEERRIFFNRLNVQYRFDGEINLDDAELLHYLKHGDVLFLQLHAHRSGIDAELQLVWRKESETSKGWVADHCNKSLNFSSNEYQQGGTMLLPMQCITKPGIITGSGKLTTGVLRHDMPFGIEYGKSDHNWVRIGGSDVRYNAVITGCRIDAKEIEALA
jgi:hypothetical protein